MPYREFVDAAGTAWRVWDTRPHSAANVRARYADGWLSFECDTERRRLCPIPGGWADAGEEELWAWVVVSEPVRPAARAAGPAARSGEAPTGGAGVPPVAGGQAPAAPDPLEGTRAAVSRARRVIQEIDRLSGSL